MAKKSINFSLVYGDPNYYLNQDTLFKSGKKGTNNCQ
jgi:hypothetical protein